MWVPSAAVSYFDRLVKSVEDNAESMQNTVQVLREELATSRAENQLLRSEIQANKVTSDWLRLQFNEMKLQNAQLLQKAYNIQIPVPEVIRTPNPIFGGQGTDKEFNFTFEDIGDEAARALGLPTYDK